MAEATYSVSVHVAWWFGPYLHGLAFFCALMQCEPNWDKVNRVIDRALVVRVHAAR